MIDNTTQISNVTRQVETREIDGKDAKAVVLSQTFNTDERNLWQAITSQNRIPMWFAPVGGDLELNGRFQVEHNAGGTITACEPLRSFDATWEFGESISWIEVRCVAISKDQTELTLTHITHPDEVYLLSETVSSMGLIMEEMDYDSTEVFGNVHGRCGTDGS